MILGEPPRGSWWSHPRAGVVVSVLETLAQHTDVILTKLIDGKVTFVYRGLGPALLGVATAREDWQTLRLPRATDELLTMLERYGTLTASGAHPRELQRRLLAYGEPTRTTNGRMGVWLESWPHWAERMGYGSPEPVKTAKRRLVNAAKAVYGERVRLPWD